MEPVSVLLQLFVSGRDHRDFQLGEQLGLPAVIRHQDLRFLYAHAKQRLLAASRCHDRRSTVLLVKNRQRPRIHMILVLMCNQTEVRPYDILRNDWRRIGACRPVFVQIIRYIGININRYSVPFNNHALLSKEPNSQSSVRDIGPVYFADQ
ncbi:hypothetical protein D3C73_1369330 [compost metagenome]